MTTRRENIENLRTATPALVTLLMLVCFLAYQLAGRFAAYLDGLATELERTRPAGPEVGPIDDEGSFCTGRGKPLDAHDARVFQSKQLISTCCNGTGFADYAAVPCPSPSCPVLGRGLRQEQMKDRAIRAHPNTGSITLPSSRVTPSGAARLAARFPGDVGPASLANAARSGQL